MSKTICGADCAQCPSQAECRGCVQTGGCPFGKQCFLAKYMMDFGREKLAALQQAIMEEVNGLHLPGMQRLEALYPMRGSFVNLPYRLPNGQTAHLLDDDEIYLCSQVEASSGGYYGVAAGLDFLLVSQYGRDGAEPELVLLKRRQKGNSHESGMDGTEQSCPGAAETGGNLCPGH